ncbi:MAG: hypothetical protein GY953_03030, partial [bacterium]|nr:hypothetical protein [bacterium]
ALTRLGERDEKLARIVELRFFGGLAAAEAGAALGLAERQVLKRWTISRPSRAWRRPPRLESERHLCDQPR